MTRSKRLQTALLAVTAAASVSMGVVGQTAGATPVRVQDGAVSVRGAHGVFRPPDTATTAFTYDSTKVPAGAKANVLAFYLGSTRTVVALHVRGLLPNREYGAHAHVNRCGATGADAGPHYQRYPSTDPAAANPANEIWLDFTTDARGNGYALAVQPWAFESLRRPGSVIIHDHHTSTGGAEPPGTAGARYGCVTVPF